MTSKIESNPETKPNTIDNDKYIEKYFQLPIYYLNNKYDIDNNIKDDLELTQCKDVSNVSLYESVFKFSNCYGEKNDSAMGKKFYK